MARRYSDQYASPVNQAISAGVIGSSQTAWSYKGPSATEAGKPTLVRATYNLANGTIDITTTDDLLICGLPIGASITRLSISSGDDDLDSDNDFTFNLGWTGSLTAILSASTVLQAGAETNLGQEELDEIAAVTVDGAHLTLTSAAGDLNSSGTIYFLVEYVVPTT